MVCPQTKVPVHIHWPQQLGTICKVSLLMGGACYLVLSSSISHLSISLHLSAIHLIPSPTYQSHSISQPSISFHLPPINLTPSLSHPSHSISQLSNSLHLPAVNLTPSHSCQSHFISQLSISLCFTVIVYFWCLIHLPIIDLSHPHSCTYVPALVLNSPCTCRHSLTLLCHSLPLQVLP